MVSLGGCAGSGQRQSGDWRSQAGRGLHLLAGVHAQGVSALFRACERGGIRRVVRLSAAGVDRPVTAFSHTKLAGDQACVQVYTAAGQYCHPSH